MTKIGIVIPTALGRPEFLPLSLSSITQQQGDFELEVIVGVSPSKLNEARQLLPPATKLVPAPDEVGLATKIDSLLRLTSESCDFIGWLGDDDLLTPGSLANALAALRAKPTAVLAFGGCDYIDRTGTVLFTNKSGAFAADLIRFGPQLIPQPGSLMSRRAFIASGGLDNQFNLAFDFDMFLNLRRLGPFAFTGQTLAQFRWHPDSLSVKRRMVSVLEASRVRRKHYGRIIRFLSIAWEPLVIFATWLAGKLVTLRTRS